ncbi:MAG: hypothetical protein ACOVT5_06620 [Armatimonadaceae bacterium]
MAQSPAAEPTSSMALRVGAFSPAKAYARSVSANNLFSIEADLTVQSVPERNESSVLSLGYIEKGGLRILPLTLSQITHDRKRTSGYDFYYGYGIGLYSIRLQGAATSGTTKVMPGALATFGLNLSDSTFLEARYHYTSDYEKNDVRGLQFSLGFRF